MRRHYSVICYIGEGTLIIVAYPTLLTDTMSLRIKHTGLFTPNLVNGLTSSELNLYEYN